MDRNAFVKILDDSALAIIITVLFFFPLIFIPGLSDFFILPKQLLILLSTIILLVIWAAKLIMKERLAFLSTPFNIPLFLFGGTILCSSIFSQNRYDSFIQSLPVLVLLLFTFLLTNLIDKKEYFNTALSALTLGAVVSSIISILYFLKIYILPFGNNSNNPLFTTFGSPIQHIAYLLPIFLLSSIYVYRKIQERNFEKISTDINNMIHFISAFILLVGISLNIYKIFFAENRPVTLPVQYGIQIAASSLTEDTARQVPSLLFGSGFGTFLTDFTRFKPASFNLEPDIWNLNIAFSSSLILELLATTGLTGTATFMYLLYQFIKKRTTNISHPLFLATMFCVLLVFIIPYSFTFLFLLLILLSFYTIYLYFQRDKNVFDVTVALVAPQRGFISLEANDIKHKAQSAALPLILGCLLLLPLCVIGYYSVKLFQSDIKFTKATDPAMLQNGQATYDLLRDAIQIFPYRDDYYRLFSQVNLSLANSITTSVQPGQQPTEEMQRMVFSLLQQSINSARSAVTVAPMTVTNWTNLGKIYRSMVNVGQNAEQFAIASYQQAIRLNQYDPQNYIETGGIFFQLGQFDAALSQFQNATTLKPDLPNAHYNLGHTYEAKGDFENALREYEIVRELTKENEESLSLIEKEIEILKQNMEKGTTQQQTPIEENNPITENPLTPSIPEGFITTGQEEELTIPAPPTSENSQQPTTEETPSPTPTQ